MTPPRATAAGALAAAAAYVTQGTPAGAVLWLGALAVACAGYGRALARSAAPPLAIATGLAALLVGATALAHLGLLTAPVLLGLVGGGLALSAWPAGPWAPAPSPRAPHLLRYAAVVAVAGAILAGLALIRFDVDEAEGVNHVAAVKRLWDTGVLVAVPETGGLGVVGEALVAWGGGADTAGLFEAACAILLLAVLAAELAARGGELGPLVFALAVATLVLEPPAHGAWSGALLHLAAVLALPVARGPAWPAVACALALALLRHELAFVAAPYLVAAIALSRDGAASVARGLPRSLRRVARIAGGVAGCIAIAVAIQLVLGARLPGALGKAAILVAALPIAALPLRLLGLRADRTPLAIMVIATIVYLVALVAYAIPPPRHAGAATLAVTLPPCFLLLAAAGRSAGPSLGAATIIGALLASTWLVLPGHTPAEIHYRAQRFNYAAHALGMRRHDRAEAELRAAQELTPAGARLALWGRSASALDFARNPITDVSFTARTAYGPIDPARLDRAEYLLLEDVLPAVVRERGTREMWYVPALEHTADRLELIASVGNARLYRILPRGR